MIRGIFLLQKLQLSCDLVLKSTMQYGTMETFSSLKATLSCSFWCNWGVAELQACS